MPLVRRASGSIRAVLFDLDHALLDQSGAWAYTVEEAVAAVTGKRVSARPLVEGYAGRPWRHALSVILPGGEDVDRCEKLCEVMARRSSMKRLLVFDGVGMALDRLVEGGIEVGAVSREDHSTAIKKVQSTGLDRFLAVLAATPAQEAWDPGARLAQCLNFLEREPGAAVFVSADAVDLRAAAASGFGCYRAAWCPCPDEAPGAEEGWSALDHPSALSQIR